MNANVLKPNASHSKNHPTTFSLPPPSAIAALVANEDMTTIAKEGMGEMGEMGEGVRENGDGARTGGNGGTVRDDDL